MPRWKKYQPDGGTYVLVADRDLPTTDQVVFAFRDPLPSEVATFEQSTGHLDVGSADVDGDNGTARLSGRTRWVSNGPTNNINALLTFLTNVSGPGPDSLALVYPARGDRAERERFLAAFDQTDLYEVAEHILERRHLSETESKN